MQRREKNQVMKVLKYKKKFFSCVIVMYKLRTNLVASRNNLLIQYMSFDSKWSFFISTGIHGWNPKLKTKPDKFQVPKPKNHGWKIAAPAFARTENHGD